MGRNHTGGSKVIPRKSVLWTALIILSTATLLCAQKNPSSNDKKNAQQPAKTVDASSFSILVNGRQVAREIFHIESHSGEALIHSELHYANGDTKAEQTADLQLGANGTLKKYMWKESLPGNSMVAVDPVNDNFLTLRYVENGTDMTKAKDLTQPLGTDTNILDDNFFSHIEVLAWKYLASACKPNEKGVTQCKADAIRYPILIPHQQTSFIMSVQLTGQAKCKWKSADHDCTSLKLTTESGEWTVFLDSADYKMLRVLTPDGLEVVRE